MKIAFCGECLIEVARAGSNGHQLNFAGDSYNTAYYLALLQNQIDVSYITAVGLDPYSRQLLNTIEKQGINTRYCLTFNQYLLGLYLIDTDESGERNFYYYRKGSAASHLFDHPDIEQVKQALLNYDYLYITGISVAILNKQGKEQLYQLIKQAKVQGITIIFDNNYRPRLWQNQQQARDSINRLMPLIDYLFVTFADEQLLFGDDTIESCLNRYNKHNIPLIVIKDGANPCLLIQNNQCHRVEATCVKKVIDTTGAGDAFNAAFLSEYLQNKDCIAAAHAGHRLAAQVIQTPGALVKSLTTPLPNNTF